MNECLTPAIPSHLFIAVLDIYGFEVFDKNSLEQFCINYANEKLHEQFNKLMFRTEQAEYKKEGVPWRDIKFNDNIGCIDLIERPFTGIIALMTEEAHMPKGSDRQLISKLAQMHSKDKYFGAPSAMLGGKRSQRQATCSASPIRLRLSTTPGAWRTTSAVSSTRIRTRSRATCCSASPRATSPCSSRHLRRRVRP